jgi:uncharacterized protein YndB with AHSA1/START domain
MPEESFEVVARSKASAEAVFKTLSDIPGWDQWTGLMVPRTIRERDGSPDPNGVGAIRKAGAAGFWVHEEIVEFIPPTRLSYIVRGPVPMRRYRSTVELEPDVGGGTLIRWRGRFEPIVPGTGPLVRRGLRAVIAGLAKRLAEAA